MNNFSINLKDGRTFDKICALYDRSRVDYPDEIIQDIINYSKIPSDAVILDVGCGTGQATSSFAKKGYFVHAIDASENMISYAKNKYKDFKNINFEASTFEDVSLPNNSVDLITSAMAWHWIKPEGRDEKAWMILKDQGTLALFWSYQLKEESDFVKAVSEKVLIKYGGENRGPAGSRVKHIASDELFVKFSENPSFTSVVLKEYNKMFIFNKERYVDLVLSYGWVQGLPEEKRKQLVGDLNILFENFDNSQSIPYQYILLLAKKA